MLSSVLEHITEALYIDEGYPVLQQRKSSVAYAEAPLKGIAGEVRVKRYAPAYAEGYGVMTMNAGYELTKAQKLGNLNRSFT